MQKFLRTLVLPKLLRRTTTTSATQNAAKTAITSRPSVTVVSPTLRSGIPVVRNLNNLFKGAAAAGVATGVGLGIAGYNQQQRGKISTNPRDFGAGAIGTKAMNNYLVTVPLKNGDKLTINKAAAGAFKGFLDELWDRGIKYNDVGGYSSRKVIGRGGKSGGSWSRHALGLAIDIDPTKNPYKGAGYTGSLPKWVGDLANKYGLTWGADFGDSMHFSYRGVKVRGVAGG